MVGEHIDVLGRWYIQIPWGEGKAALCSVCQELALGTSYLAVPDLCFLG